MSYSKIFYQELGAKMVARLPSGFKFHRSTLEWKKRVGNGYDVIQILGNSKWSPVVNIYLSFGKRFDDVAKLEKLMGLKSFRTHIQVTTAIRSKVPTFPYLGPSAWTIDIENPPESLEKEMLNIIEGLGFPFFDRFGSVEEARNELEKEKSTWCNTSHWMQLFHLDAALSEVDRFVEWSRKLEPFQKDLADKYVAKFRSLVTETEGGKHVHL
jgi:hypothetical protein